MNALHASPSFHPHDSLDFKGFQRISKHVADKTRLLVRAQEAISRFTSHAPSSLNTRHSTPPPFDKIRVNSSKFDCVFEHPQKSTTFPYEHPSSRSQPRHSKI